MKMPSQLRVLPLLCLLAGAVSAQAPYSSTLTAGTGLVTIPVAWVSPATGDFFLTSSARSVRDAGFVPKASGSRWDFNESVELHLGGRASVGMALYDPATSQVGAFGQVVLVRQSDGGPQWLPSLALGVRNLGSSKYQDRYVTGNNRVAAAVGGVSGERGVFNGSPTVFGVATRDFTVARASAAVSVGFGNGLFREDGQLGDAYNTQGTLVSGLFFGGRMVFPFGDGNRFALMGENDGFDFNVGANVSVGNVTVGVYATEVEEQKSARPAGQLANFTKVGVLLGYNASLPGMVRGSRQRAEAAEAKLALRRLEQEVTQRRIITERLVADLARATQAADAAATAERQRLIRQLEAEQAALKAAADRLEALTRKPPEAR